MLLFTFQRRSSSELRRRNEPLNEALIEEQRRWGYQRLPRPPRPPPPFPPRPPPRLAPPPKPPPPWGFGRASLTFMARPFKSAPLSEAMAFSASRRSVIS